MQNHVGRHMEAFGEGAMLFEGALHVTLLFVAFGDEKAMSRAALWGGFIFRILLFST